MTVVEERANIADAGSEAARRAMIDSQLRVSGINDPDILAAFLAVPREDFLPEARRAVAYADRAVALGDGAVLSPALTYGQMLIAAEPAAEDSVLVIGNPGGYLAALAAQLAAKVTLVAASGDWAGAGQHTLVLVDGAIEDMPAALAHVLTEEGRLVTGVVERGVTRLALGRKVAGALALTVLAEADFAALATFVAKPKWSF
ncbi:protein-L-isoaspartate O-methyltransferase [Novosphingobium fuchskuhlense]|uniref:Protein-L-isoaspartate O-methyltransferase n=1 Tax=Novosphingobium fuchskuhlense TaxID=1117702 RepID=A0A117UWP5_9SPHN|nr:protein-L-isoaspartate O-methyltransferase [Novosphingobium fuchskuhlense]KUR72220.1 protein-L-isoaspartate O-methyltransferase [Novosphingobium fuchskuhlense]